MINIKISEVYKGNYNEDTVQVNSHIDEGGCGISPDITENWLIFAYKKDGGFKTTLCTRSKRIRNSLQKNSKEIIEEIRFLKEARGSD